MEILIYRNDEDESIAERFTDVRLAIDFLKLRAEAEGTELNEYIIKVI